MNGNKLLKYPNLDNELGTESEEKPKQFRRSHFKNLKEKPRLKSCTTKKNSMSIIHKLMVL